jgi:hypothetical protein
MQSLCNQSVTRKMSWSVRRMAGVMIDARARQCHRPDLGGEDPGRSHDLINQQVTNHK